MYNCLNNIAPLICSLFIIINQDTAAETTVGCGDDVVLFWREDDADDEFCSSVGLVPFKVPEFAPPLLVASLRIL